MSTHRKPAAVPIRRAAPALIPATVTVWVTLPEMRPIITLTATVIAAASIYAWTQTRPWGPRARAAAHAASRALSWVLSCAGYILRFVGLIIRAILWAASLMAFLSIVGYALGLCGDGNRHYR